MMRSLYSGVAGLQSHQTAMDVIGNNIANVNTVGFKSSSTNFTDTYYQTIAAASGANSDLGTAGTNAKQIGLGSSVASITVNVTEQGGASTTNRSLDICINGEAFLIVRSGNETYFTKSGALNIDAYGNLYCTTNGAIVQGWLADADGNIIKDTVQDLVVMSAENMYYAPEATTAVTISGNVDPNDSDVDPTTGNGEVVTFSFYDNIGNSYMVKMLIQKAEDQGDEDSGYVLYTASIVDIFDSNSNSVLVTYNEETQEYEANTNLKFTLGGEEVSSSDYGVDKNTGEIIWNEDANNSTTIYFNSKNGTFASVGTDPNTESSDSIKFSIVSIDSNSGENSTFPQLSEDGSTGGIDLYFSSLTQYSNGGTSQLSSTKGDPNGMNSGYMAGSMTGISIDQEGKIWGTYDNGMTKCLAQIAVATFANPSGLESVGNSLFAATLNSGEFDGVGSEILLSGSFTIGALEMSNVDLATEFTQMIIIQRGFQANSRIITVSDSMLEELVNLKRS